MYESPESNRWKSIILPLAVWFHGIYVHTNAAKSPCTYVAILKLQQLGASVIETVSTEGRYKYWTEPIFEHSWLANLLSFTGLGTKCLK